MPVYLHVEIARAQDDKYHQREENSRHGLQHRLSNSPCSLTDCRPWHESFHYPTEPNRSHCDPTSSKRCCNMGDQEAGRHTDHDEDDMHDLQMRQTVGLIVTEVNTTGSFHSLPHTLTQTQPKRDIINLTQEQNCLRQIDAGNDVSHARCASTRIENCNLPIRAITAPSNTLAPYHAELLRLRFGNSLRIACIFHI